MSLLIKALKKAELRHQEATAQAIEQVSTDPTIQAAAHSANHPVPSPVSSTTPQSTVPKPGLELQLQTEATEPSVSAATPEASPFMSPVALEAMYMSMAKAHAQASALATSPPVAETGSHQTDASPAVVPAPESPLSSPPVFLPAAVREIQSDKPQPEKSHPAVAPNAQTKIPVPPGPVLAAGKEKRLVLSSTMKLGGISALALVLAGAYLGWQMYGPVSYGPSSVSPGPAQALKVPLPPKAGQAEPLASAAVTGAGSKASLPTRKDTVEPALNGKAVARAAPLAPARQSPENESAERLATRVGPQIALDEGAKRQPPSSLASTTTPGQGTRVISVDPKADNGLPASSTNVPATPAGTAGKPGPKLIRTDQSERVAKLLEQAFTASGKLDRRAARELYQQVIDLDRNNVDALIGLASLSARDGDANGAERLYQRILELDPSDAAARAGLASLRVAADPAGQESQLRHLLASQPAQPSLLFALGNSLSAQGRWSEAQQAYFQALSGDQDHPDYAFNLAISLERIHQGGAALNYYRSALDLSRNRPARFSAEQARSRIQALERRTAAQPQAALSSDVQTTNGQGLSPCPLFLILLFP